MRKVVCNGVKLNYNSIGEGSDVVLIHGLATNHAFWRFEVLLTLAEDYRVTVFDLRGHGHSEMPLSGYTLADMAEDLHCLLNHLHISEAHLIGHSFGGVVTLQYAVDHSERVASLTIADTMVRALQPTNYIRDWPMSDWAIKKLEEFGLSVPEDESESGLWLLEKLALTEFQQARHKLKKNSLFIPLGGWNGGRRTAERWLELLYTTTARQDVISSASLTIDRLSTIQKPTLAIYGENSPAMPSFHGLREHLPNCKTKIIPGAGHLYPLTQPKPFVGLVSKFLKELEKVKL